MTTKRHVDYGLDAPKLVRNFFLWGIVTLLVGAGTFLWGWQLSLIPLLFPGSCLAILGLIFLATSGLMVYSSRIGKMKMRDILLDALQLKGNETILDVGCGRGLLLIGAAKRLPQGRAVGVDLWSQIDQADNRKDATLLNAELEGVLERINIEDGDMRCVPFPDNTFDIVVANLAIHNIQQRDGRRDAIYEIVRVLKPGGRAFLMDFSKTQEYKEDLAVKGMNDVQISGPYFWMYPPVRIVSCVKPQSEFLRDPLN